MKLASKTDLLIAIFCLPIFRVLFFPQTRFLKLLTAKTETFNLLITFQTFLKSSFAIQIEKYYSYIFIKLLQKSEKFFVYYAKKH